MSNKMKAWRKPLSSIGWQKEIRETVEIIDDKQTRLHKLRDWYYEIVINHRQKYAEDLLKNKRYIDCFEFRYSRACRLAELSFEEWIDIQRENIEQLKEDTIDSIKLGETFEGYYGEEYAYVAELVSEFIDKDVYFVK